MSDTIWNDKLPPHDIAAEEALLGAIFIDPSQYDEIQPFDAGDFYHEPHQFIYNTMVTLVKRGEAINQITVAHELDRVGKLEASGGVSYLLHLIPIVPTPFDAYDYAKIVRQTSISRQLIQAGKAIEQIGFSSPVDSADALSMCDAKLIDIRRRGIASPILSPKEYASRLFSRYKVLQENETGMAVSTGIPKLDKLLGGGFYDGDLIVTGARAHMGKTTLLSYIAWHVQKTRKVLICSAEMDAESLGDRQVAQYCGVAINRIRWGGYDDKLYQNVSDAVGEIAESQIYIYDVTPMTTTQILEHALTMQLREGLGLLIIDYLSALDDHYGRNSYERIGYISHQLKIISRVLHVPVLVAHQLNRQSETRRDDQGKVDHRPKLDDLRDSGAVEQDADTVLMLYREGYWDKNKENEGMEIWLSKLRQGKANRFVKVQYDDDTQSYRNIGEENAATKPMFDDHWENNQ